MFVHSLRSHLTLGGSADQRYDDNDVFDCSEALVNKEGWKLQSGLFEAIRMAYSGHYHLHLRPDDIWLAIAQGVSAHLLYQDNAERYRDKFVDHQGQEDIVINVNHYRRGEGLGIEKNRRHFGQKDFDTRFLISSSCGEASA